jgi:hypothetical protein
LRPTWSRLLPALSALAWRFPQGFLSQRFPAVTHIYAGRPEFRWIRAKRKALRRVLCQDRDEPKRYFNVVFFDSYEAAMENSMMPETDSLSRKIMSFADGPPSFYNLDVVDDQE